MNALLLLIIIFTIAFWLFMVFQNIMNQRIFRITIKIKKYSIFLIYDILNNHIFHYKISSLKGKQYSVPPLFQLKLLFIDLFNYFLLNIVHSQGNTVKSSPFFWLDSQCKVFVLMCCVWVLSNITGKHLHFEFTRTSTLRNTAAFQ